MQVDRHPLNNPEAGSLDATPVLIWLVRLGGETQGPWSEQELRAKRDAGLLGRWHEASRDGRAWVSLDEALRNTSNHDPNTYGLDEIDSSSDVNVQDAASVSNDWLDALAAPAARGATSSPSISPGWRTTDAAVFSATALWLVLLAVPVGWWQGEAVRPWSWPGGWSGVGVVVAQAWWAGLSAVMLVRWGWRRVRGGREVSQRFAVGLLVATGVLGLLWMLLAGAWTVRGVVACGAFVLGVVVIGLDETTTLGRTLRERVGLREVSLWSGAGLVAVAYLFVAWLVGTSWGSTATDLADETAWSGAGVTPCVLAAVYVVSHGGLLAVFRGDRTAQDRIEDE